MNDGEPVTYQLSHWPAPAREALRRLLWEHGIDTVWQYAAFSVPASSRSDVDRVIATMSERREPGTPGSSERSPSGPAPEAPRAEGENGIAPVAVPVASTAAVAHDGAPALYRAEPALPPPGWYADPTGRPAFRWWDGRQWTEHVGPSTAVAARAWFPPRGDREQSARGGGIALVGFVVGQVLSVGAVLIAIALGAESRSVVTLIVGELALWFGLFGACRLAVRRHGSGSLRDLGLTRLRAPDFGIGALAALVARVGTLLIAVILILVFSFDDLTRETSVTDQARISTLGAIVVALDRKSVV